jgi:hypothetical protein
MLLGAKSRCLARDPQEKHKRILWADVEFMNVEPGDI